MDKLLTKKNLISLLAVLMTAVLVLTLFVFRLGIADNGSLSSQLEETGFYGANAGTGSGYFSDAFGVADTKLSFKTYSLAYEIFKFVGKDNIVYVYFPALIYALVFIGAVLLLGFVVIGGKNKWSDLICVILFVLVLCDSGYTMLFNTPYKEASFIVYLIATVSAYVYSRQTGKLWCSILFVLFGILLGGVSTIGAITAIILGLCGVISTSEKRILNVFLAGIIVVCGAVNVFPKDFNAYDSFFFGVTVENPYGADNIAIPDADAEQILEDFGVDQKLLERVGTSTYTTFQIFPEISVDFADVFSYYVKNPKKLLEKMEIVARNSTTIRTGYLSNYLPSTGKAFGQTIWFSGYSFIKKMIVPASYVTLMVILAILVVLSLIYKKNYAKLGGEKAISDMGVAMGISSILTMPLPLMLYGFTQLNFNMLSFNFMFDVSLVLLVIIALKFFAAKRNLLKEKYGVNQ